MIRHLVVKYAGRFEGSAHGASLGSFLVRKDRWELRCWGSGAVLGGSVARTRFTVSARGLGRYVLDISSFDGRFTGLALIAGNATHLEHELGLAKDWMIRSAERRQQAAAGKWWLDPRAFAELGAAEATSVMGARLSGRSSEAPLRRSARGVLDFERRGIILRGGRRRLHVPWEAVQALSVAADGNERAAIEVRATTGSFAFTTRDEAVAELQQRLGPLIRRIDRAAARSTR